MTTNKGQLTFLEIGSNKGVFKVPLFAILEDSEK